jgi:hypothetical protein
MRQMVTATRVGKVRLRSLLDRMTRSAVMHKSRGTKSLETPEHRRLNSAIELSEIFEVC